MKKILLLAGIIVLSVSCAREQNHGVAERGHEMESMPGMSARSEIGEKTQRVPGGAFTRKVRADEVGISVHCPVMGTKFKVKANTEAADYKGKSYYFCCPGCPVQFKENPGKYINSNIKDSEQPHMMHHGDHGMMKNADKMLSGRVVNGVREINVKAFQFGFDPDTIIVKKGEKIRLKALSTDVTHGIAIKGYKINQKLPPNKEKVIEFTADKAGEFHFHCSVYCGAGHRKMHGKLIVKE